MFESKYHMSLHNNILWAKRNLIDSIWKYTIDEINAVNDLKHAWQFLLDNIENPVDLPFTKKLYLHSAKSAVINTNLDENKISRDLSGLSKIPNPMDMALEIFLFFTRGQFFYDGNKRLATLMTNKIMIQNGLGVFAVPIPLHTRFYQLLVGFYESQNKLPIKQFLYDNCISRVSL